MGTKYVIDSVTIAKDIGMKGGEESELTVEKHIQSNTFDLRATQAEVALTEETAPKQGTKVIWKYPIAPPEVTIEMPDGAWPIAVQAQDDQGFLWALVNPDSNVRKVKREFIILGTGWEMEDSRWRSLSYVGTYQVPRGKLLKGNYVWHVFEKVDWIKHITDIRG